MFDSIIIGYLSRRLVEPSTYLGLIALLSTNFGVHLDPDFASRLVTALTDLGAVAAILLKDGGHVWARDPAVHPLGTITTKGLNEDEAARHQ